LVLLDELSHHLHRLGWAVRVVVGDVVDLAAVDAALVVDLLEVGTDGLADGPVGGRRPTVRIRVADLDLGSGDPGSGGGDGRRDQRQRPGHDERKRDGAKSHGSPPLAGDDLTPRGRRTQAARIAPAIPRGIVYMKTIKKMP